MELDIEQLETRVCLFASILLTSYLIFMIHRLHIEDRAEYNHHVERCVAVAAHKINAVGKWDEETETCVVRMRFESNLGAVPNFYEQDVPIDQLPPPSA